MDADELQYRLIYSILVAGKNATFATNATQRLLAKRGDMLPFDYLATVVKKHRLTQLLQEARTGNYLKTAGAIRDLLRSHLDLTTCTAEDLERIHGIGPKTARFFLLWTRPDAECAALDVHILRWLRGQGYDAPAATPTGRKYRELEQAFLKEAKKRGLTPRELDAMIWDAGNIGRIRASEQFAA